MPKQKRQPAEPTSTPHAVRTAALMAEVQVRGLHQVRSLLAHLSTSELEVDAGDLESMCALLDLYIPRIQALYDVASILDTDMPTASEIREAREMMERGMPRDTAANLN
jgi:hypothetical protein